MSNLVKLYEQFQTNTVEKARQIPKLVVDYFDREHKIALGFTTGKETRDPTDFIQIDKYDKLVQGLTPPDTFNASLPLHRYNPKNTFYDPGQPSSGV